MARPLIPFEEKMRRYAMPLPWSGCHVWLGSVDRYGYPKMSLGVQQRALRVSRLVLSKKVGRSLSSSELACHSCDNTLCVNEQHLFLGSHADNVADKVAKNRQAKGSKHGRSKLTEDQAKAVKYSTKPTRVLMQEFSVSKATVEQIRSGMYWRHV